MLFLTVELLRVTEPLFVAKHLANAPVDRLAALQRDVEQLATVRPISDRRQASDLDPLSAAYWNYVSKAAVAVFLEEHAQ